MYACMYVRMYNSAPTISTSMTSGFKLLSHGTFIVLWKVLEVTAESVGFYLIWLDM